MSKMSIEALTFEIWKTYCVLSHIRDSEKMIVDVISTSDHFVTAYNCMKFHY